MSTLWQDLRYGARMLLKNPGFTLIVLLTLSLGIGANTAIFSVVNAVMLRQLPFVNADRLVRLNESNPERGWPTFSVSQPNFLDWRARNQTFEALAATISESFNLNAGGEVEVVPGASVTADFLPVLGITPALGRNFLPEEDRPGGNTRVALVTHGFWQRRFGGNRAIVGKTLQINDNSFTIVGVLPETFNWGVRNELFTPLAPDPAGNRGNHNLQVIGRLKPGVTWEHALADLNTIARQLAQQYPESNKSWSVTGQKFYEWIVPEQSRRALLVFAGAVIFVLLIACSNVANLLLARAAARQREMAIRMTLGAGRGRIIRQLLCEAFLLALVAGGLGLLVALWTVESLKTMNPATLPRLNELSIDGRVLAFSLWISLITGVLFGLFPALQASRPDLNETLKEGGRSGASGRQRARGALVIAEVALSVALLIGAGLLLRSFAKLQDVELGFKPENLLTMRISLPRNRYSGNQESWAFYKRLLQETKALPGVQDAALTSSVPLSGLGNTGGEVQIPGRTAAPDGSQPSAAWRVVSPGYLRMLGIPLRGRDFDERDTAESQPVTIISEEMARRYWPGEDPLGKPVTLRSLGNKTCTIIGIAGNVRSSGPDTEPGPAAYVPTAVAARAIQSRLVVRTRAEPAAQASAVRGVLRSIDANVPVIDIQTVEQLLSDSLGSRRFNMFLLGSFAAVALLLASVGLFGVMSYLVSQRTHEIGIRLALGALPRDVLRLVIRRGMLLASIGAAVGLVAAFALARYLETLLFQIRPTDALVFTVAPLLLLGVALLACYVPARRAMRVDPMVALRHE
jgi:putative ABC transport system permease protein